MTTFKQDFTVFLYQNQTDATIPLPKKLEHVQEVWLTEYQIIEPSGTVWRLNLADSGLVDHALTNAPSQGTIIAIDNSSITHVVYETPRMLSKTWKGTLNELRLKLVSVLNTGAAVTTAAPTFVQAVFMLTFILRDTNTDTARTMLEDKSLPQSAYGQFVTRAPWK